MKPVAVCPECGSSLGAHRIFKGYDIREVVAMNGSKTLALIRMQTAIEAEMQFEGTVLIYCRAAICDWNTNIPSENVLEWP